MNITFIKREWLCQCVIPPAVHHTSYKVCEFTILRKNYSNSSCAALHLLLHIKRLCERVDKAYHLQLLAILSLISASNDFIHHHYAPLTKASEIYKIMV